MEPRDRNRREHYPLGVPKGHKGNSCYLNLVRSINIRTSLIGAMPSGERKRAVETERRREGWGGNQYPSLAVLPPPCPPASGRPLAQTNKSHGTKEFRRLSYGDFSLGREEHRIMRAEGRGQTKKC